MIFKCLLCGKDIEVNYVRAVRVFCSRKCNDNAVRGQSIYTAEEIRAEKERRIAEYKANKAQKVEEGLSVNCIICGAEMRQRSATPRLYCSMECRTKQGHKLIYTQEQIEQEKERRRVAFQQSLSESRRKVLEYGKKKRGEFYAREAERLRLQLEYELKPTRHCHNFPRCKNLTWDYYCPDCRRKKRMAYLETEAEQEETESIWDDFTVPSEPL